MVQLLVLAMEEQDKQHSNRQLMYLLVLLPQDSIFEEMGQMF